MYPSSCIFGFLVPSLVLNIHVPGIPTLLVWVMLIMPEVNDPGMVIKLPLVPALIPARASFPPNPLLPQESVSQVASPVVHCILFSS